MFGNIGEKVSRGVSSAYQLGSKVYGYAKSIGDKAVKDFGGLYESPYASGAWNALKQVLPENVVSSLEGAGGLAYKGVGLYNKAGQVYHDYVEPAIGMGRRAIKLGGQIVSDVRQGNWNNAVGDARRGITLGQDVRSLAGKYNASTKGKSQPISTIEMRKKSIKSANAIPTTTRNQQQPTPLSNARPQVKPIPKYRSGRF
jgi:hypothetical protein